MHKHKLGLARNGRALMCVLPDCHTSGKPFVVAGGDDSSDDSLLGGSSGVGIVSPDYQEISLCDHEQLDYAWIEFVKNGTTFCAYDGKQLKIYRLPNCFACGRAVRISLISLSGEVDYSARRFCTHCGAQVLDNGELVTA